MKIMHVYRDCLDEGGVPHLTRRLIAAQAAQGDEVLVVTAGRDGGKALYEHHERIQYWPIRTASLDLAKLGTAIRDFAPDVAHVRGITMASQHLWVIAVRRLGIPYVVSLQGALNEFGMTVRFGEKSNTHGFIVAKRLFRRFADLPLLRNAASVHAECEFAAELARARGARQVFSLPIGIDDEWINPSVAGDRRLHPTVTFLHLGRLDIPQKGLDLVLDAAALVAGRRNTTHGWKVILAGSSVKGSAEFLSGEIRRRGIEKIVELREPVWDRHEKEALWREADFFFSVFRYGGMPRATAEAVGNGLPLLASRESNWGDWVAKQRMGTVADLTPDSVAARMEAMIDVGTGGYRAMADNTFRFAENHSWDKIARAFSKEYERVLV